MRVVVFDTEIDYESFGDAPGRDPAVMASRCHPAVPVIHSTTMPWCMPDAVRCFGSEGRKKDGKEVPASDQTFEYVVFNGEEMGWLMV